MSRILVGHVASLLTTVIICNSTHAGVVGFQESFSQGAANWRGSTSATALKWSTVGSSIYEVFVTSNFNLANTQSGGIAANIIRAAASAGSSAGAYQGNRAADGVTGVSLWFRHDLAESIALSFRVASPQNYPVASAFDGSQHLDARRVQSALSRGRMGFV